MSQTTIFSDRITKASRNIPEVLLDLVIDTITVDVPFWFHAVIRGGVLPDLHPELKVSGARITCSAFN